MGGAHDGSRRHLGKRFNGSDLSWDKKPHAIFLSDTGFSFHFYERLKPPCPPMAPSFRNPSISVPCPCKRKNPLCPSLRIFFFPPSSLRKFFVFNGLLISYRKPPGFDVLWGDFVVFPGLFFHPCFRLFG